MSNYDKIKLRLVLMAFRATPQDFPSILSSL
ncbi:hypothetical protein BH11PSE11_BH11PSE11_18270 [soil metagenome]